jgi:hypothetical protein
LLFPSVPLNNFRVITGEQRYQSGTYFYAALVDIDFGSDEDHDVNRVLLHTYDRLDRGFVTDPRTAMIVLLTETATNVDKWFAENQEFLGMDTSR